MMGETNFKACVRISIFFLGMACTAANGRTIYVDYDGSADFSTIQAAIDDSNDGDTIIVANGTYTGDGNRDIEFSHGLPEGQTRAITVRSANGPHNCIIDCNGSESDRHRGFRFVSGEDANSAISGFTITNGYAQCETIVPPPLDGCQYLGGAIHCGWYSSPTIMNCIISGNTSGQGGGGISCFISNPTVSNCTFTGNLASYGGGIWNSGGLYGSGTLTICVFWGNSDSGGTNESAQVYGGSPAVNYSCIQGLTGALGGTGNIGDDPYFADPCNGDYHLKSQGGRWEPSSQSWVLDDDTSPCIDAGNPGCPEANEPLPNGGRINMGAYGGTAQASKSPVNWRSIADMTNDWILDFNDLKVFVSYWLERGECVPSDLNRNESVDFADFCILGQQWSDTNAVKAHSLYPADGSVILGDIWEGNIYTLLIFTPGATAVKHTGYFSEDYSKVESRAEDANLGSPPYTYIPGWEYTFFAGNPQVPPANHTLVRGTQYYWTVDETDAMGNTFPGDIWEFAVQGYYAFEPDPPNEAVDVDTTVLLSWYPGLHMVNRNDVYIGTSWDDVNNADSTDTTGIYKGYTSETFYQCSNLAFNTTYYWRIDELYCHPYPYCHYYKGDVWCFTTVPPNLGAIKEELWFGIAGRAIGDLYSDPGSTTHTVVNHRQDRKGNGGRINMGAYGGTPEASKSYFSEPVCETIIAGDINGDCKVNFLDFSLMAFHWLKDNNP